MKRKLLHESLDDFRLYEANEPLAMAVLGAPAGGKSYTMQSISKTIDHAKIKDTIESGVTLTVDNIRDEFRSKDPREQLKAFAKSFYFMKKKAKENPEEYGDWFKDSKLLWKDKLTKLMPEFEFTVDDNDLKVKGYSVLKNLKVFDSKKYKPEEVIKQLDSYNDYKRVVRYFQNAKQKEVQSKQLNVSYDESGDEPTKIVNTLKSYHKKGYVTDVFLIHPENVASNLIQNYYRVLTGGDGGRDSSDVILQAYLKIEKSKHLYQHNSEETVKTTSQELAKENPPVENNLKKANVEDDKERGDKPIDVFTEVEPMKPLQAYKFFSQKLDDNQNLIFKAILKYRMLSLKNLPENAKEILNKITKNMSNQQALQILQKTAESGKYIYNKIYGITPELAKQAETFLK